MKHSVIDAATNRPIEYDYYAGCPFGHDDNWRVYRDELNDQGLKVKTMVVMHEGSERRFRTKKGAQAFVRSIPKRHGGLGYCHVYFSDKP